MMALLCMTLLCFLGADAAAENCIGEFIADADSGECVLAANGGDVDEPTAYHATLCGPSKFLCPDRKTCVGTAAAYARCATGKPHFREPDEETMEETTGCTNFTGVWSVGSVTATITMTSPVTFDVVTDGSLPFAWHHGNATVGPDGTINIIYSDYVARPNTRTGTGGFGCKSIEWNVRAEPPPPPLAHAALCRFPFRVCR